MEFDFNMIALLQLSCCGFSFVLGHRMSLFGGFPHPPVDGCTTASCDFGVLTGEMSACPSTPPSWD